jgi:hypothetical protein
MFIQKDDHQIKKRSIALQYLVDDVYKRMSEEVNNLIIERNEISVPRRLAELTITLCLFDVSVAIMSSNKINPKQHELIGRLISVRLAGCIR